MGGGQVGSLPKVGIPDSTNKTNPPPAIGSNEMKRIFILVYWFLLKKQSFKLYMFHRGIKKDIEIRKIQHERMREVSQLFRIVTIKLEKEFINWR